jgi:hypothetical protein
MVLQRLTPAERAVLLLRDVFDFEYGEIADLVGKSEPACRKLLDRARQNVAAEKRLFSTSPEEHGRLLAAFTEAASAGATWDREPARRDQRLTVSRTPCRRHRSAGARRRLWRRWY